MKLSFAIGARIVLSAVLLGMVVSATDYLLAARRASERSTMPSAMPSATPKTLESQPSEGHEGTELGVAIRLVDQLGNARVDVPNLGDRQLKGLLTSHWRRHIAPMVGPGGELGRMVQSIGLSRHPIPLPKSSQKQFGPHSTQDPQRKNAVARRSERSGAKDKEARRGSPFVSRLDDGELRERNLRTFGLGEGTYDQRECIVAPPPAALRFKLHLPKGAKLRVAPALLGDAEVAFTVSFRPTNGGEQRVLGTTSLRGPSRSYVDWTIDLSSAGLDDIEGELTLLTEAKSREPMIALWGSPVIIAPKATRLPYNVLFIIVDAMRSDAISASHDPTEDQRRKQAKYPPLDAWFEAIPEVAPELDRLATVGVIWEHSWSTAMWTRPATLSLLTGLRASHTGLEILALELLGDQRRRFYARRPPLLPLIMRQAGATTTAFVNNMYLSGSVGVGVDFGFESVVDHRLQALDTRSITSDALRFLDEQGSERFFLLLNYAAPHAPYEPPPQDWRAVHSASNRPADPGVLNYLGEVHKDDAAIGQVLGKLDELRLRDKTLVIVTADHGETMSQAHDVVAVDVAQGVPSGRFTHLSTMWEEAARVAMILSLPGKLPMGRRLSGRVQTIDLLPTILELEGLPVPAEVDGRSLLPALEGKPVEERPIVIEGRGARSIIEGDYHLIVREPVARRLRRHNEEYERTTELYDLRNDPGERKDITPQHSDVVARLRAKLEQVLSKKSSTVAESATHQRLHFRFSTAGRAAQLEVLLRATGDTVRVLPVGIDSRAVHLESTGIRILTTTSSDQAVGFDLEVVAGAAPLAWEVRLDAKPWPADHIYVGPLGIAASGLAQGLAAEAELSLLDSPSVPHIVASEELGMFVTRDPIAGVPETETSAEAQLEAQQAMQAWGYARKPLAKKP